MPSSRSRMQMEQVKIRAYELHKQGCANIQIMQRLEIGHKTLQRWLDEKGLVANPLPKFRDGEFPAVNRKIQKKGTLGE